MINSTRLYRPRSRNRGSVALFAIIALIVAMMLVFVAIDTAMSTRILSKRMDNGNHLYLLAHGGLEYGYWKTMWLGVTLPYVETNRALGGGTLSVRIENNSGVTPNTFKVTAAAAYNGKNLTLSEIYPLCRWHTLSLAPYATTRYGDSSTGIWFGVTGFAEGKTTYGSVPFNLEPSGGTNTWSAYGGDSTTLTLPVSIYTAREVHLLLGTIKGQSGPTVSGYVECLAANGTSYRKNLLGDRDIRCYKQGPSPNAINGTTTQQVFSSTGNTRLDKVVIALPPVFNGQTLTQVRVVDTGSDTTSRLFCLGVTVRSGR